MAGISTEVKALFQKSGNRCAFPGCGKLLSIQERDTDETVILSNVAHIVAQRADGPRGKFSLPMDKRDLESNLILLCLDHHKIVDDQPQKYTVERLRGFKEDHEKLIENATGNAVSHGIKTELNYPKEIVYSTLFEILKLPVYVYETTIITEEYNKGTFHNLPRVLSPDIILPFIIENGRMISFQNPEDKNSPFHNLVISSRIRSIPTRKMWTNPVEFRWFVELLNKSINIFMEQKGLSWDPQHYRYFFSPDQHGKEKQVAYRPLNQNVTTKNVVWCPITKKTGLPKSYWLHRALSLRFLCVSSNQWCMSLRPEFRVTKDGYQPIESEKIGAKITKKKSRMFNYDLLGEINFWRSYLSSNEPRINLNYGNSYLSISSNLLSGEIKWPGIPEKYAKSFSNIEYAEDLFTWAKLQQLQDEEIDIEADELDEDMLDG